MTSANLIPDIERDEGCRLEAYPDPLTGAEPWTIGYGATGAGIGPGTVWTQAQADADLDRRVAEIVIRLHEVLPWFKDISDPRQDVLVNMAYNLGLHGLLGFHNTLAAIQAYDYPAAAAGFLHSLWARQVGQRAVRLARQMATGVHQT